MVLSGEPPLNAPAIAQSARGVNFGRATIA